MGTRLVTRDDIPVWLALAHQGDDIVRDLVPDISTFYEGFDEYMDAKVRQNEALMTTDEVSGQCLGLIAFSLTHNRISFLGVTAGVPFHRVGSELLHAALDRMDRTRDAVVNVLRTDASPIRQERALYERFGFAVQNCEIREAGAPAILMVRAAA